MADSADRGKRSLIVMVLAFLITGGGVFVFLIFQSLEDMQDVKFRSFGSGMTGRVTLPILKYFNFVDKETPEGAARAELALKLEEVLKAEHDDTPVADGAGKASAAVSNPPRRDSFGQRPSGRIRSSLSGVGALGGSGGSKSFSSFSGAGGSGGLKLSGKAGSGGLSSKSGKTIDALASAGRHLTSAANTGSARNAKSRWDQAFGLKHAGEGGTGQVSSYNKAAVELDEIETGEVGSLKLGNPTTLDVPEVGKPKAVETPESVADKAKEAMKKNMADQIAKSLLSGLGGGGESNKPSQNPQQPKEMPDDMHGWIDNQLALGAGDLEGYADTDYDYKQITCSVNCPPGLDGKPVWQVSFNGQGDNSGLLNNCLVYPSGGSYTSSCF